MGTVQFLNVQKSERKWESAVGKGNRAKENKDQGELNKSKWSSPAVTAMLVAGTALMIVALVMLVRAFLGYKQAGDTYANLRKAYVFVTEPDAGPEREQDEAPDADVEDNGWWYRNVNIDIASLKKVNSDVVGWIRFDNIGVLSYPVLYSGDDVAYLYTDIYGRESNAGCIFLEGGNTPDFSDSHTLVYGHNMKDGSMFGQLKKYNEEGFFDENRYFTVYTEDKAYRYEIFAYEEIPADDEVYTIGYKPGSEFAAFIDAIRRKSYVAADVPVEDTDKVMTLSTCTTTDRRFVVHGVRIAEHSYGR